MQYGLLLEYYRKKFKLSCESMLFNESENFTICNIRTYKRIVAEENVRNKEEIISDLFVRLGIPLAKGVDVNYESLSKSIEYGNNETILEEIQLLMQYLKPYQFNAVYVQHYEGLKILKYYYKDKNYPTLETAMEFLYLQSILDPMLVSLLHIVFFHAFYRELYSKEFTLTPIVEYHPMHLLTKINLMMYYLNCANYGKGFVYFTSITDSLDEANVYAKVLSYPMIIELLKNMEEPYEIYEKELDKILFENENYIPNNTRNIALANLGINCIKTKEYEKAMNYFGLMKDVSNNRKLQLYIYEMFSKSQLNIHFDVSNYIVDTIEFSSTGDKILYKYFILPNLDLKKKNKILLNMMRKNVEKHDVLYIIMIEEELNKNCTKLNRYKDIYEFNALKCRL